MVIPPYLKNRIFLGGSNTGRGQDNSNFSHARKILEVIKMQKTKKPTTTDVKKWLLNQLELKKARTPCFEDMVCRYVSLLETLNEIEKAIEEQGVVVQCSTGMKENPCVKQQVSVNAQMLKILTQLNITTDNIVSDTDDEL